MNTEKLIRMANQIGDFYEAYPDEEARQGIADHLQKFWNSVMMNAIVGHVKEKNGEGLHARVIEAVKQYIA